MPSSVPRLRRWFAWGAILMIATVAGMYFYAQWRVRKIIHAAPAKIGLDIQQTAEGFSVSKSEQGRTLFTVSASKAVQFKTGGRAELRNVKIVIYGKDAGRFDRITGDDFAYDPASGDVSASGKVFIDLEANPEGMRHSDQTAPALAKAPIHLESEGLVFNKNTGDASASGDVVFQTPQAAGTARGIQYVARTGTMNLLSAVTLVVNKPGPARLHASSGTISKQPRQVVLNDVRLTRAEQQLQANHATFFLRDDNTVDHIVAEGDVRSEMQGRSQARLHSDRAELSLTGSRNQITAAVLNGNVRLVTGSGDGGDLPSEDKPGERETHPAEASAARVALHFIRQNVSGQPVLQTVHAEGGVRLWQPHREGGKGPGRSPGSGTQDQDVEITAPVMDFTVNDGRLLERAETSGPPKIVISQAGVNQSTVITAGRFTARFTDKNRLTALHGEPDARIVSSQGARAEASGVKAIAQSDRVSTSQSLDVIFRPAGGVSLISQSGSVTYSDGMLKASAQRGEYTAADQLLVLSGSPRVVDSGMTTTAQTIRMNRATGDAIAEGNVKSTYSDLKAQPDGGMLAASDPIHVTSRSMTAHRSPAVALYTGDARLWQNANVVEAPSLQFDRDHRSLVAQGAPAQPTQLVSTVLVQADKRGSVTPIHIWSATMNYVDAERKILLAGGVKVQGGDATMTARKMTVFLRQRNPAPLGVAAGTPGQVDRIIAEHDVLITQPARHATGDHLEYTAAEDKFVVTGGTPSIFDAERGKITGDSLTFFRHDDRVLVEGKETSPAVTKTQVAR